MLIDTHGHVNFNAFKEDQAEVLKRTLEGNVWVVMPGSQYSTSRRAVEIAGKYQKGVYAAVGVHPIHLEKREVDVWEVQSAVVEKQPWMTFETRGEVFEYEKYKELTESKKVVAIGEVGLDYYRFPKSKARREELRVLQLKVLKEEVNLALEKNLPVIFHCRVAHEDLIQFISEVQKEAQGKLRGTIHSYTGTAEQAKRFLDLGMYIGFNGLIFKNVLAIPSPGEVIPSIPLERIVLETDSPYLTPPQTRGVSDTPRDGFARNEPLFVEYVAKEVARIKQLSFEEVAEITTQNAKILFRL